MASIIIIKRIQDLESALNSSALIQLHIGDIKLDVDYRNLYIQGTVKFIDETRKHTKNLVPFKKIIIQEDETEEQITVILTVADMKSINQFHAFEDCGIEVEDILVVSNASFGLDPQFSSGGGANYQAFVNLSLSESRVVLLKRNHDACPNEALRMTFAAANTSAQKASVSKIQQKNVYSYTKLRELTPNTVVNVYGVVKHVREAAKTRGLDYSIFITIIDDSLHNPMDKLKCVLFGNASKLPTVQVGDIIRFHRLKIETYNNALQGQAGPGFSWIIFEGSIDGSLTPVRTFHENNTITVVDLETVKGLRTWSASVDSILTQDPHSSASKKQTFSDLASIVAGQYFNLMCQVVGTCVITEGESMLLKVWDGTEVKLRLYEQDLMSDNLASRLHIDENLAKHIRRYIVDVWVFDDHFVKAANVKPDDFVILQNLHAMKHKPRLGEDKSLESLVELCLHHGESYGRGLTILDPRSKEVDKLQGFLHGQMPVSDNSTDSIVQLWNKTEMDHENCKFVSNTNSNEYLAQLNNNNNNLNDDDVEFFTPLSMALSVKSPPQINGSVALASSKTKVSDNIMKAKKVIEKELSAIIGEVSDKTCRPTSDGSLLLSLIKSSRQAEPAAVAEGQVVAASKIHPSSAGFNRQRCMLTTATVITGHHHIKITPVEEILRHTPPYKFRFQGYALNFQPRSETVSGFLQLYCDPCRFLCAIPQDKDDQSSSEFPENRRVPFLHSENSEDKIKIFFCPDCNAPLEYIYMIEFILNDGTGSICAGLWRKEGDRFFGSTAIDLLMNPDRYQLLLEKLDMMCFGQRWNSHLNCGDNEPRKMECCLMSYNTPSGISYQIFDTTFAVDC